MLFSSKHLFHDWFRKGIDIDIIDPITNVMDNLISLWANDPDISLIKIKNMLNLRWSILDYLYEREGYAPMEVKEHFEAIRYNLKEKYMISLLKKNTLIILKNFIMLVVN